MLNCIVIKYKSGETRMLEKWKVTLPELTGRKKRRAYVWLPEEAARDPERRFPVLYMFDGHNVFLDEDATYGKSWGLGDYLSYTDTPLIVAAVECNHGENFARIREYAPYPFVSPWLGEIDSRGQKTMDWLVHSFKPMIDSRFPTLPDREHTFIAGSSMGGLMSLYALAEYNEVFSRAAALSPSIDFGAQSLDAMLKSADFPAGTVLYMDMGEKELRSQRAKSRWRAVCRLLQQKGVLLTSRVVPGGEHNEASWEKQNPFFISTLLYDLED